MRACASGAAETGATRPRAATPRRTSPSPAASAARGTGRSKASLTRTRATGIGSSGVAAGAGEGCGAPVGSSQRTAGAAGKASRRSMTLRSSRTLPGQRWLVSSARSDSERSSKARGEPCSLSMRVSRPGRSSSRSRSAGSRTASADSRKKRSSRKRPRRDLVAQRAVRAPDDAHVDGLRRVGAEPSHLAPLDEPQQLRLQLERQFADLVEHQRAGVGRFDHAHALAIGTGERALLGAEQLTFEQRRRGGSAVEDDERAARARRCLVHGFGGDVFARAGLAFDEQRRVRLRDRLELGRRRRASRAWCRTALRSAPSPRRRAPASGGFERECRLAQPHLRAWRRVGLMHQHVVDEDAVRRAQVAHPPRGCRGERTRSAAPRPSCRSTRSHTTDPYATTSGPASSGITFDLSGPAFTSSSTCCTGTRCAPVRGTVAFTRVTVPRH